jgi:hypothetical protein
MAIKLASCPRLVTHQFILEQVLANEIIVPSLLKYYPYPHEAKAHCDFIRSLRAKLGKVKNPYSKDK